MSLGWRSRMAAAGSKKRCNAVCHTRRRVRRRSDARSSSGAAARPEWNSATAALATRDGRSNPGCKRRPDVGRATRGSRPSCSASWDWRNRHAATADLNAPRRSSLQRSDSCGCDLFWAGPCARRGRRRRSGSTVRRSSEPSGAFVGCDTWDTKECRGETGRPSRRPPRLPTAAPLICLVAYSFALDATRVARRRSGRQRPLPHTTATGTPGTLAPAGWLSE